MAVAGTASLAPGGGEPLTVLLASAARRDDVDDIEAWRQLPMAERPRRHRPGPAVRPRPSRQLISRRRTGVSRDVQPLVAHPLAVRATTVWKPCICAPARKAAEQGGGMGQVCMSCNACHEEVKSTVSSGPPHDDGRGHLLTGWMTGPDVSARRIRRPWRRPRLHTGLAQ